MIDLQISPALLAAALAASVAQAFDMVGTRRKVAKVAKSCNLDTYFKIQDFESSRFP